MNPIEAWLTEPDGIAAGLRALRKQAGLTGIQLANAMGATQSKVSKLENGRQIPTAEDVTRWCAACNAPETASRFIEQLTEVQAIHNDWRRRMKRGQTEVQENYGEIVRSARRICHFETVYIPGLLQTADYARRVLTEMIELHDLEIDDVDTAVAARIQRQSVLYDQAKKFELLLAEPVLRWLLPSVSVMGAQLDRLQTVIGLPNVRFGILPMGRQLSITPQNSFQLYDELAVVETFVSETSHQGDEAMAYARVLDRMWQEAVVGDDARTLINRAKDWLDHRDM